MDKKDKKIKSDEQDEVKTATAQAVDTQQEEPTSSETAGQEANAPSELEQKALENVRLKEQLETAQRELASLKEQMLRDRADLENYRKRLIRDKEDSIKFANENLIKDLLQPLDDFSRALEAAESTKDYAKVHDGVVMVNSQLYSTLEKNWGLQKIESVGKEFNPEEHEAYMVVADDSLETETVLEEFIVGYKLHGRVLRPSKVKVGKPNV
ncbi:MAG: nucleotide exchange factor GrpE [Sphaerochaeta associata]|uniref:nucleotide exchange factor GrpE n=1 Tax=Sphaerochaeta associata TaxID=1129264 RepID=UPI002B1F629B|nr:nucleotide exchange factor GrpE [Sphaerochaeta associata]MEA5027480.1 nucleotide exchange factor GrpE [Sphaerochaeta associata]